MDFWYSAAKSIVRGYLALFVRKVHLNGKDMIPPGPKILVANHALATDGFLLPFLVKEKVHFLVQADIFSVPVIGRILSLADQIPVYSGRGQDALDAARQRLDYGHVIAIFPEGKLNHGKKLLRGFTGATRLAIDSGAPIVPIGFYSPPECNTPINARFFGRKTYAEWQFGGPCFIQVGEPWRIPQLPTSEHTHERINELTTEMMQRIDTLVQKASTMVPKAIYAHNNPKHEGQ